MYTERSKDKDSDEGDKTNLLYCQDDCICKKTQSMNRKSYMPSHVYYDPYLFDYTSVNDFWNYNNYIQNYINFHSPSLNYDYGIYTQNIYVDTNENDEKDTSYKFHYLDKTANNDDDVCNDENMNLFDLVNDDKEINKDVQFECNECKKICENKRALNHHIRTHMEGTYFVCTQKGCEKLYKTKIGLQRHIDVKHKRKK